MKKLPQNCPMSHNEFVDKARAIHGDRYEYLSEYQTNKKPVTMRCTNCGSVFNQMAHSHLDGCGCRNCQYLQLPQNQPEQVAVFEERCRKLHGDAYEYCGDYRGGRYKIKIFCKRHQEYFQQSAEAHLLKGHGCPKCCFSRGERRVAKFLKSYYITYETEKRFDDCRRKFPLRFDFYLPDLNLCIEYDGPQHYAAYPRFGGKKRFLEAQQNDAMKNAYCEAKGIALLRIPFFEYENIEKILEEKVLKC